MKDRVPTKPGRVKLTKQDGTSEYVTMERADDPTEAGTPLNKASLLSDSAVEAVWANPKTRPADPKVSEAFNKLSGSWKIGDIKNTIRTDLGESWLLCNGAEIPKTKYPELYDLSTAKVPAPYTRDPGYYDYGILEKNGVYVKYGLDRSSEQSIPDIRYSVVSPSYNLWNTPSFSVTKHIDIHDVKEHDGLWVAVGADDDKVCVLTTHDPTGTWTVQTLSAYDKAVAIYYIFDKWIMFVQHPYNVGMFSTTTPESNWGSETGIPNTGLRMCSATDGNKIVMFASTGNSSPLTIRMHTLAYPGNSWTSIADSIGQQFTYADMFYADGVWMVTMVSSLPGQSDICRAYASTDDTATWALKCGIRLSNAIRFTGVRYFENSWYISANSTEYGAKLYKLSKDLSSYTSIGVNETTLSRLDGMSVTTDYLIMCGSTNNSISGYFLLLKQVPTITHEGSYTYIKALGE